MVEVFFNIYSIYNSLWKYWCQIPQFRTQIGTKRKMLQAAREPFPLTTSRNEKASDLEASWVWCRKYLEYLLYFPLMSQSNIPFFTAAKNGLSVDSASQWNLEVEQGCAIITLHMSFFTSEQLPVVFLLSLITVTSKKSPPRLICNGLQCARRCAHVQGLLSEYICSLDPKAGVRVFFNSSFFVKRSWTGFCKSKISFSIIFEKALQIINTGCLWCLWRKILYAHFKCRIPSLCVASEFRFFSFQMVPWEDNARSGGASAPPSWNRPVLGAREHQLSRRLHAVCQLRRKGGALPHHLPQRQAHNWRRDVLR